MSKKSLYEKYVKRPFDLVVSLVAVVLLIPLFLLVAILVRFKLGKPVIFKQSRPGKNEKIFTMYKFRTMSDTKDSNGNSLPNDKRLTKFGKLLRSLSLDELPGLFNIIKGDMSLVGPRPLLVDYLKLYTEEQKLRHNVRPGLTGLAQVNGRNTITWEEKFKYDISYVGNITFYNDMIIILKTIFKVIKRDGVNKSKNLTMDKFNGRN